MYLLYNLIFVLLFIIYLPLFIVKILMGKYRTGFWQRFGFIPKDKFKKFAGRPIIWVHAVSVGETVAASPLVKEIKKEYPDYAILFSTVTDTGQKMAKKIIKEADVFIYFPLDLSIVIRKIFSRIRPELFIIMESELWPNFIRIARKKGVKIVLANGRISDKSAKKYKYLGPYLKDMLNNIELFCMQSKQDVSYILQLGAEEDKVFNTGNTKLDQNYSSVSDIEREAYYKEFKIKKSQQIFVVGSTHPGEEEEFIKIFKSLQKEFKQLIMIIAPRHIERSKEIENLYLGAGISIIRRSRIVERISEAVILLDTIGELAKIYSIADLVFVGGSFVELGGHNILEPAAHGKLVFFGPHMFDFKDSTSLFLENKAAVQVQNSEELIKKIKQFLKDPDLIKNYSQNTKKVIEKNKGASARTIKLIMGWIS